MVTTVEPNALIRFIVLLPLAAAIYHGVALAVLRRPSPRWLVIGLSCGAVGASFVCSCVAFWQLIALDPGHRMLLDSIYTWVGAGVGDQRFTAEMAFQMDSLSAVMSLVVTGVGSLIHVYSIGYMDDDHRDDKGFQRFFCYLNLFVASMLVLVLADNLLLMFLGWEGVGLCSYLLIGFWYGDAFNAYCGAKAFIVNRVGDFAFLVGFFLLFWALADAGAPAVSFRGVAAGFDRIADVAFTAPVWLGGFSVGLPTLVALCLFVGACGKSAQLPLYVWLPDAMAGPTPVSALIHAATMVTAGVYMICRMSFLYAAAPEASAVVAWVGGATALFAATIAVTQNDIKKVLAYSTVSQLGYMVMAAGCLAYSAAIFHVVTHAFFKALLFMGAGSVILALHHEQDVRKMGGLRRSLLTTWITFALGVGAIGGFPLFSGFFSKEEAMHAAFVNHEIPGHMALYGVSLATAFLTAFYMARLLFLVFHGESRVDPELRGRVREPAAVVTAPLIVLAALSVVGGFVGLPQFWGDVLFQIENSNSLAHFLHESIVPTPEHEVSLGTNWALVGAAQAMFWGGLLLAWLLYLRAPDLPGRMATALRAPYRLLLHKYWVDELYDAVVVRPLVFVSDRVLYRGVDAGLIDGVAVDGTARGIRGLASRGLKYAQSGMTPGYLLLMVAGAAAIVKYLVP